MHQKAKDSDHKFKKLEEEYNAKKAELNKKQTDTQTLNKKIAGGEKEIHSLNKSRLENENHVTRIEKKLEYDRKTLLHLEQVLTEKKEQQEEANRQMDQMKKGQNNIEDLRQDLNKQIGDCLTN